MINTIKLEKIFALARAEIIKLKEEVQTLKDTEILNNVVQEFCKIEGEKAEDLYKEQIFSLLNGKEQAEHEGVYYTYKPLNQHRIDLKKLKYYCLQNDMDMKDMFYTYSQTKPTLKIKVIK